MDNTAGVGERGATSTPSAALPALAADDPTLAALTEALLDYMPPLPGPRFPLIHGEAEEVAAAILAHPAMADLARKAAAFDSLLAAAVRWRDMPDHPTASQLLGITRGLEDAIAAAMAAASPEDER